MTCDYRLTLQSFGVAPRGARKSRYSNALPPRCGFFAVHLSQIYILLPFSWSTGRAGTPVPESAGVPPTRGSPSSSSGSAACVSSAACSASTARLRRSTSTSTTSCESLGAPPQGRSRFHDVLGGLLHLEVASPVLDGYSELQNNVGTRRSFKAVALVHRSFRLRSESEEFIQVRLDLHGSIGRFESRLLQAAGNSRPSAPQPRLSLELNLYQRHLEASSLSASGLPSLTASSLTMSLASARSFCRQLPGMQG